MNQAKCTTCGAGLTIKQGDKTCVCAYCQSTNIVENALALGKVEVDVTEDIKRLRGNLTIFVQQNSIDEILRVSQKLLDWIPQDFVALYFFGYAKQQQTQPRFLYDFYKEPPVHTQTELEVVVEHIIHKSELRDKGRLVGFFELHFSTKLNEYLTVHKEREQQENNYANIPRDVFVCFSSYNKDVADRVVQELEADGNTCWISTRNLRPEDADNYWMNIENAIGNSTVFLVISSEESMRSKDVHQEIDFARKYQKKLVEFKIDDAPHNTLFKHVFNGIKWVKGTSNQHQSYAGLIQRIFDELDATKPLGLPRETKLIKKRHTRSSLKLKPKYFFYIGLVVLITSLLVIIDFQAPEIELFGDDIVVIRYGQLYKELGAYAIDNRDGIVDVIISGEVDTSIVGSYVVTYEALDSAGNLSKLTRQVDVVDDVPPRLNFIGLSRVILEAVTGRYNELGINAIDEYEGLVEYEITGEVDSNTLGEYVITYSAKDQFGNSSSIQRIVQVIDSIPPVLTIVGPRETILEFGQQYNELGPFIARDLVDGDVDVVISGQPNITQAGEYEINYTATDKSGNSSTITRVVRVIPEVICEDCKAKLSWTLYQVNNPINSWTNYNGIYSPASTIEFNRLSQISSKLADGTSVINDAVILDQIQFFYTNSNQTLLSWTRSPNDEIESILGREVPDSNFALIYNGYFVPTQTGNYQFTMTSDDASELFINDELLIGIYGARALGTIGGISSSIQLKAYEAYPIQIRFQDAGAGNSGFAMYWRKPNSTQNNWIQDSNELYNVNPYER